MRTLKDILDEFGWNKVQHGQFPSEIPITGDHFIGRAIHQYDLYALKGVFAITEDGEAIVDLSGIAKVDGRYARTGQMPGNSVVKVPDVAEFLGGFKHLHSFRNAYVFVKEEDMHFPGIGKRIEDAGLLYQP
ncbi:MAG: hypothetical protein WC796_05600 [Candidatus Pacearchaeota archaeon]|jgi:hypothetical protein